MQSVITDRRLYQLRISGENSVRMEQICSFHFPELQELLQRPGQSLAKVWRT